MCNEEIVMKWTDAIGEWSIQKRGEDAVILVKREPDGDRATCYILNRHLREIAVDLKAGITPRVFADGWYWVAAAVEYMDEASFPDAEYLENNEFYTASEIVGGAVAPSFDYGVEYELIEKQRRIMADAGYVLLLEPDPEGELDWSNMPSRLNGCQKVVGTDTSEVYALLNAAEGQNPAYVLIQIDNDEPCAPRYVIAEKLKADRNWYRVIMKYNSSDAKEVSRIIEDGESLYVNDDYEYVGEASSEGVRIVENMGRDVVDRIVHIMQE